MEIKTLTLKNYKKFKNQTFEFEPGLNVVLGSNEAGKSTLAGALLDCIYADVNTRSKGFFDKIQSWQNKEKAFLEITFKENNSSYTLSKDFGSRTSILKKIGHEDRQTDPKKIQEFLIKNFGIADEEIYHNTGFVKQQDISKINTNQRLISTLQTASRLQTGEVNLQSKVKQLKAEIMELKKGLSNPAKNPGFIKKYQDELEKTSQELNLMKTKWDDALRKIQRKEEISNKLNEDEKKLSSLRANIENTEKYRSASSKIKDVLNQISQISDDIEKIKKSQDQIVQIDIRLSRYKGLLSIDRSQVVQEFRMITEKNYSLEEDNIKLQRQIDVVKKSPLSKLVVILPIISVFIFLSSLGIHLLVKNISITFVLFIIGFVPLIILGFVYMMKKDVFSASTLKNQQKENMLWSAQNEKKLDEMVKRYNVDSREDFLQADSQINTLVSQKEKLQEVISTLLRGEDISVLEKKYKQLLIQKNEIEVNELNPEILNSRLDANSYVQARAEVARLSKDIEKDKGEIIMIQAEIDNLDVYREDIVHKESLAEELDLKLKYYEERLQILEILVEYLEKSIENTSAMVAMILRKDIQKYFAEITNGKYNEVNFETNLKARVFSKEAEDWIDPFENLSEGALDQLNFLIRLAYFKLIRKDKNPFMILDDPFVNFDTQRRTNAMEIVAKEAQDFQIFFFSHNKDYASYGNIVKL